MKSSSAPFTVSAPGSLMLMGEHAVLQGRPALCMAVNPRMRVSLSPRSDREIRIDSALGRLEASLDALPVSHDLGFVLACIRSLPPSHGFDASITSELDATRGLGTSAAVTVAMTCALHHLTGHPFDPGAIAARSRDIIVSVQGRGSGCDAAASTFGGIVRVEADPFRVEPLHASAAFAMAYAGYKTPTPEVIQVVDSFRQKHPKLYDQIFSAMASCVDASVFAIRNGDWEQVGQLMTRHHYLQGALGTSDRTLDDLVHAFLGMPGILGAKISGSGLGDSVLALGHPEPGGPDQIFSPVELSETGVRFDD